MFNVGDIVVGMHPTRYSYTGIGSTCRVLEITASDTMRVAVMTAAPERQTRVDEEFTVYQKDFMLRETKPMKIEIIPVYYCEKEMGNGDPCGDTAEHRVTIPGLSVVFCAAHARPYLKGETELIVVTCRMDHEICKPGYRRSREGLPFCSEHCEQAYISQDRAPYAGRPY